jgi:hypothetical protein
MGLRRSRRRYDDHRTADRIAAALALIRQSDERRHGLAVWLSHSGMDHDPDLLDKLAARAGRRRNSWRRLQEGVHFLFRFFACKRWVITQQFVDHLLAEQLVDHLLTHLLRRFRRRLGLGRVIRWIRIADPGHPLPG